MDVITVFQQLIKWCIPALMGGFAVILVLMGIYRAYRYIFHGKKQITKIQAVGVGLLCCWALLVLGLTSFSRGSNFTGSVNINFLSGYISAWNNWSIGELQLIIFNMIMFAPLGFLLPLVWKRAEKLWVTIVASLGFTGAIEIFQFFTGTGIFELDDLFHNLIGSIFGYFCIIAVLKSVRQKKVQWLSVVRALLIPCVVVTILGVIVCVYQLQPYGNMSILPAVKQDMSAVNVQTSLNMSNKTESASVYKSKFAKDKEYIQNIKTAIENLEEVTFFKNARRENENLGYIGENADGTTFRLMFFSRSGEWNYTTFDREIAPLAEEEIDFLREKYEGWMNQMELLPKGAEFSVQNGDTLRWDIGPNKDIVVQTAPFQMGTIMLQFDKNNQLVNLFIKSVGMNMQQLKVSFQKLRH